MKTFVISLLGTFLLCSTCFGTTTLTFYNISHNDPGDAAIGESQLSVDVIDDGGNVTFTFQNSGPEASVICEIYFDNSILMSFVGIDESLPQVDYKNYQIGSVAPGNLPAGNAISPPFMATMTLSIEPTNPEPKWGVGPGEWVSLTYSLQAGKVYQDVLNDLASGDLRIGIHVQAYDSGGSESFIAQTDGAPVPEPATMFILAAGGLMAIRFKK